MNLVNKILSRISIIIFNSFAKTSQINVVNKQHIHPDSKLENAYVFGNVQINKGVILSKGVHLTGNIGIGDYSSISGPNTSLYSSINRIEIGKFCSIARNVSFQEYFHHSDRLTTYMMHSIFFDGSSKEDLVSKGDILVGNDVWIGMDSVILSGVKIGNGAIIGANSVVNCDVPDYAVVAGVPAKIVKYRFSPSTIDLLNLKKWWDWDLEKIKNNKHLFETNSEEEIVRILNK
jgi:virginiamycin A acetyltransferase